MTEQEPILKRDCPAIKDNLNMALGPCAVEVALQHLDAYEYGYPVPKPCILLCGPSCASQAREVVMKIPNIIVAIRPDMGLEWAIGTIKSANLSKTFESVGQ